ncbi:MAG TPA: MOFRL family protein, partial [Gammaproteobacteria bacterium]|nr:MOFRL family protein [Gammaproteobacteria bacterium]
HPGRGGRNQLLALAVARRIANKDGIYLLAAGTDGSDGTTSDAGALVDGGSIMRGEDGGFDATDCLTRADAGTFLEASSDLIYTGPTGTNVMDLVIALKE